MTASPCSYVLVTPAYNEAENLERTIEAVTAQTHLPRKWVIVSDGSTDGTDDIVLRHAACHSWIELVRMPERETRHFAGKVYCFQAGQKNLECLAYDVIGNLDADITFGPGYFEFLMGRFAEDPHLGVGGTPFVEDGESYNFRFSSVEHVSGACQMFRRECFDDIGGYVPVAKGGIDVIAVLTARMKGWKTRTFTDMVCQHHRKMGSAAYGRVMIRFKDGEKDYYLGSHPLWELFRMVYQMGKPPRVVGGLALYTGYVWSFLRRQKRPITTELMHFRRREQMQRLRRFFLKSTVATSLRPPRSSCRSAPRKGVSE